MRAPSMLNRQRSPGRGGSYPAATGSNYCDGLTVEATRRERRGPPEERCPGVPATTAPLQLGGMPEPAVLRRHSSGGETLISYGRQLVFRYADDDTGMRNMAVVALTDAGVAGREVAAAFGLSPEYVSRLRAQARRWGAPGLVRRRGRPPKLSEREVAKARRGRDPRPRSPPG